MENSVRPMRRKDRLLTSEEASTLLSGAEYGILSTVGQDAQPYATPLSFVVENETIYFHCAFSGQKIDNLKCPPKICFCTVGKTQPIFENNDYSTYYESTIAYGNAYEVTDATEKEQALRLLCQKYLPKNMDAFESAMKQSAAHTAVWGIRIHTLTGKAKRPKP